MLLTRATQRILFICTANVCRSPLAEALLRHRLRERGLQRQIAVASAGTRVGQVGRKPDPRVLALCNQVGVSLRGIRARPVDLRVLARSSRILVMEQRHVNDLAAQGVPDDLLARVQLLSAYLAPEDGTPVSAGIPDPYFADREGFLVVCRQIDAAVLALADVIAEGG